MNMTASTKSVLWVLLYCAAFTTAMSLNKHINPEVPSSLKLLFRGCFGFLFILPFIIKSPRKIFVTNALRLHFQRFLFLSLAMGGTYYTYTHLPLTLATALGFSGPIFTATLAFFILKDKIPTELWGAIFLGYIGVLLMVDPNWILTPVIFVALGANIATGLNLIMVKKITQKDSRLTILAFGNIGIILVSFLWYVLDDPALLVLSSQDLLLIALMGTLGSISQYSYISALSYSSPSFLAPFEYFRLVIAIPIALWLGEELGSFQQMFGVLLIIGTTWFLAKRGKT
jgi:drug/metabolite transporter (DMT)-like permease